MLKKKKINIFTISCLLQPNRKFVYNIKNKIILNQIPIFIHIHIIVISFFEKLC